MKTAQEIVQGSIIGLIEALKNSDSAGKSILNSGTVFKSSIQNGRKLLNDFVNLLVDQQKSFKELTDILEYTMN